MSTLFREFQKRMNPCRIFALSDGKVVGFVVAILKNLAGYDETKGGGHTRTNA